MLRIHQKQLRWLLGISALFASASAYSQSRQINIKSGSISSPAKIKTVQSVEVLEFTEDNKGSATYLVDITQAGKYDLSVMVSSPKGDSNSIYLSIDNQSKKSWNFDEKKAQHIEKYSSSLSFQKGVRKIKFEGRERGVQISQIILKLQGSTTSPTPSPSPSPSPTPTPEVSCNFNGAIIAKGAKVTAYKTASVAAGESCESQSRVCEASGKLSGTYTFASCKVDAAPQPPITCTLNGQTVIAGQSIKAFQNATVPSGSACVSENRLCSANGLSGTYAHASCYVLQPVPEVSPTPEAPSGSVSATPSYLDKAAGLTVVNATSLADAVSKAAQAVANTRIVLPSGTINGGNITINATGAANKPVVIAGQADGSTVIQGKFNIIVKGAHVLISNLNLQNYDSNSYGSGAGIVMFDGCAYCGIYNSKFVNSPDAVMSGAEDSKHFKTIFIKPSSQSVEVIKNTFRGKKNAGSIVLINRDVKRASFVEGHRVSGNLFIDRTLMGGGANDFDVIRIGDSNTSQTPSPAAAKALLNSSSMVGNIIEFNVFENVSLAANVLASCVAANSWTSDACKGEPELISVKAPQTIVRFNTFRNCSGGLTLRHGYQAIVEGNYFIGTPQGSNVKMPGSYGIRLIGDTHVVVNNHFENLQSPSALQGGISILPGQPSAALNGYWEVYDSIIAMNFVRNVSDQPVSLASEYGNRSKTLPAEGIEFAYNIISGGPKAFVNHAPSESFLSTFDFHQNVYDSPALGITTNAAVKVAAIQVSAIGDTGASRPADASLVSKVSSSSAKRAELLNGIQRVGSSDAATTLTKMFQFLKIQTGSVYENASPLKSNQVGSAF